MKIMATSFKRMCVRTVVFSAPDPAAGRCDPHLHQRLLDTRRQVWLSLLWGHCSFLLAADVHKALFVPSKSLFPWSCVSAVIKSHWPPKSNSLEGSKMVGGVKLHLESNPIPARDTWRVQTKSSAHQYPETPQRLSQTCLWVFECLLQTYGSAVACHRGRGSGCSRPGSHSVWHKPS